MAETARLYGSPSSLFTAKLRTYLRWKALPYEEHLSSSTIYKDLIVPRTGVRYIPVLEMSDGRVLQDTQAIIDTIETEHPGVPATPPTPRQRLTALLIEFLADEWLVIPAMHYRWSFPETNRAFILHEFGRTALPDASEEEQVAQGARTAEFFGGSLPVLGVTNATIPAIEAGLAALLAALEAHFAAYPYLLGGRPCIADFALMGPLYAHLGRDPYPLEILQKTAPLTIDWIARMNAGGAHGTLLLDDMVPETLAPILHLVFNELWPVAVTTAAMFAAWRDGNPGQPVPRGLGMHDFRIGDASGSRMAFPFLLWKAQRPVASWRALTPAEHATVDPWLDGLGGLAALRDFPQPLVGRHDNRVVAL